MAICCLSVAHIVGSLHLSPLLCPAWPIIIGGCISEWRHADGKEGAAYSTTRPLPREVYNICKSYWHVTGVTPSHLEWSPEIKGGRLFPSPIFPEYGVMDYAIWICFAFFCSRITGGLLCISSNSVLIGRLLLILPQMSNGWSRFLLSFDTQLVRLKASDARNVMHFRH